MFDYLANPTRFINLSNILLPFFLIGTILLFVIGLYIALIISPDDYQQGSAVKIMYIHVPSAWLSLSSYFIMAVSCFFFLVWRHPLADLISRSIAPIGAMFAFLTLVTGAIWGKPIWGVWWVWDARLTSMLILLLFFIGFISLSNSFENSERGSRPASILAIIGAINIPIIKFSVDWWNTLHQPASILRSGGISIDTSMLIPLVLMSLAFHFYFILLVILNVKKLINEKKILHALILRENNGK